MKFKKIIESTNWETVRKTFLINYPDQEKNMDGYERVYKKLRSKPPTKSNMELCCELVEPILKVDEPYVEVYAMDGTKREDGSLEKFSLGLSSWSKWLGSSVSESTLATYSNEEIISHCLNDMTFYGFSETDIKKVRKDLENQSKDIESPIRYVIVSTILLSPRWQFYFDVSTETWSNEIDSATLFKREKYARAILDMLNEDKEDRNKIAKITIKNKKRKVLKYLKMKSNN